MEHYRTMKDPLGNAIQFWFSSEPFALCFDDIRRVVTAPAFIIQIGLEKLYFIRLLDFDLTVLIEAEAKALDFVVQACTVNPPVEYISLLLEKGRLIPFL